VLLLPWIRRSPLFPYTTLFRSLVSSHQPPRKERDQTICPALNQIKAEYTTSGKLRQIGGLIHVSSCRSRCGSRWNHYGLRDEDRSEEHTSELQSRENLVCRLLL